MYDADKIGVAVEHPPHVPGRLELSGKNAHGYTRAAGFAGRSVGDVLGSAETTLRQKVVELASLVADQMGEDLALELPLYVWAGRRGGQEELGRLGRVLGHVFWGADPDFLYLGRAAEKFNRRMKAPFGRG